MPFQDRTTSFPGKKVIFVAGVCANTTNQVLL